MVCVQRLRCSIGSLWWSTCKFYMLPTSMWKLQKCALIVFHVVCPSSMTFAIYILYGMLWLYWILHVHHTRGIMLICFQKCHILSCDWLQPLKGQERNIIHVYTSMIICECMVRWAQFNNPKYSNIVHDMFIEGGLTIGSEMKETSISYNLSGWESNLDPRVSQQGPSPRYGKKMKWQSLAMKMLTW